MELVTGAMGSLLSKLGELLKEEYNLQRGVRAQVQSLTRELEIMHVALRKVAEVPHEQLDELVKLWAGDVRKLSYDMEDIVDTFLVHVEDGNEASPNTLWLKKLMEMMGNWFSKGKDRHQIAGAIQDINKQIQEVANRRGRYTADNIVATPAALTPIDPRLQALYREATELVGIDGKRDQVLIKMLSEGDDVSKKKLKIVSVVGFGGLGKTTLARAVYDKIKGDFDCSVFVSVGRNPGVKKVFMDILLELDKKKHTKEVDLTVFDERMLIDEIREFLKNKRYLIIIDDIWDKKHWREIKLAFSNGNNLGSRLITTTRKGSVSEACCSFSDDEVYKMEPLSDDDSQRLFYERIFSDRNGCPPEFEQVSRDILKKCGGVPLAIITLARLLASNGQIKPKDEWYTLLNSIGRGLTEDDSVEEMQRILSFSYYDLPSHLKTCLLYLSIFPEDSVINRDRLIWKWIAEGFVQHEKKTSLFELGESYFNELINRNMIQPVYAYRRDRVEACRVHDMVLDLICALSSEENFVTILNGTEPNSQSMVRRLSLQNSKVDETTTLDSVSQVRSITVFTPAINLMPPLLSFRVLRVLDLHGCDLGGSINLRHVGNLFHLRYLDLAGTRIRELPAEIGKLQFLQVLDVRRNYDLRELSSTVVKLRRLMCLLVSSDRISFPDGMGNLTSMEVLHTGRACPNIVKELRNLTRLRELVINFTGDESFKEAFVSFVESLCNLRNIQSLAIYGRAGSIHLLGERWTPPRHLHSFISGTPAILSTLPAWDPTLLSDLSVLILHSFFSGASAIWSTLPAWDPTLLSDLSVLSIIVKEVRQEDLQILGRLLALRSLVIGSTHQTQRSLLVSADGFRCVIFFQVACYPTGQITFQRGALPRAQEVRFLLHVRTAKDDGNGDFDVGLGNLISLRQVRVIICDDRAIDGEAKEAKVALRHAVDAHPNHAVIKLDVNFFML